MSEFIVFLWIATAFLGVSLLAIVSRKSGHWILFSAIAGLGVIANVLASAKIIQFPFGLHVPAGILAYMLSFFLLDILSEFKGKKIALHAIYGSLAAQAISISLIWLMLIWPPASFMTAERVIAVDMVLGLSPRLFIAGLLAFAVSSVLNVLIFNAIKSKTGKKLLWLRNNTSTITSILVANLIFIPLGYYGTPFPVMKMIKGHAIVQIIIAMIDTLFIYFVLYYKYPFLEKNK
ncbi:queuosine precursor transporter [Candidatus Undinarchaeota archaeon]